LRARSEQRIRGRLGLGQGPGLCAGCHPPLGRRCCCQRASRVAAARSSMLHRAFHGRRGQRFSRGTVLLSMVLRRERAPRHRHVRHIVSPADVRPRRGWAPRRPCRRYGALGGGHHLRGIGAERPRRRDLRLAASRRRRISTSPDARCTARCCRLLNSSLVARGDARAACIFAARVEHGTIAVHQRGLTCGGGNSSIGGGQARLGRSA
jgi:hypothetical protein